MHLISLGSRELCSEWCRRSSTPTTAKGGVVGDPGCRGSVLFALTPGACEAVTKLCRRYATQTNFSTLPSTPPSATCWAKLFRAFGTRFLAACFTDAEDNRVS